MDWLSNKAKGASNLYVDKICAERISEAVKDAISNPMKAAQRYGLSSGLTNSFMPFRIKTRSHYKKRSNLRKGSRKLRTRKGSRKSRSRKSRGRKSRSRKSKGRKSRGRKSRSRK